VDAWKAIGATSVIAEPRGAGLSFRKDISTC